MFRWFLILSCMVYGCFEIAYGVFDDEPVYPAWLCVIVGLLFFLLAALIWRDRK